LKKLQQVSRKPDGSAAMRLHVFVSIPQCILRRTPKFVGTRNGRKKTESAVFKSCSTTVRKIEAFIKTQQKKTEAENKAQ
jgi:hypothetical protein